MIFREIFITNVFDKKKKNCNKKNRKGRYSLPVDETNEGVKKLRHA